MGKKPVKIKRYSKSMGSNRAGKNKVVKTLVTIICAVVLLGAGYFCAPFVINVIETAFTKSEKPQNPQQTPTVNQPDSTNSEETDTSSDAAQDSTIGNISKKTEVYCEVNQSEILTLQDIQAKAKELKDKGVSIAVITLKDINGEIYYETQTEIGKSAMAKTKLDLKLIVEEFKKQGITSAANIYTFMDKTAPNIKRETAVKYLGTEYNWLDTAKELGGKPWTNPASVDMQNYIYALTDEILNLGFKEIIYQGTHLPTGYSLEKRDFGASMDQLQAHIKGFINTLQTKTNAGGAKALFAFELSAIIGEDYAKYIITPQRFGAENIIIKATEEDMQKADISQLANKLKETEDVARVIAWQTDINLNEISPQLQGYFVK